MKRERTEYTINKRIMPAVSCRRCGGATEISVFLPNVVVIACVSRCMGTVTEGYAGITK